MQAFIFLLFQSLLVQISWWNGPKCCSSSSSSTGHVRTSTSLSSQTCIKLSRKIPLSKQRAELLLVRWLQQLVWSDVAVSLAVLHWSLPGWDWDAHTYLARRNQTQAELSQRWRSDPTLVAWLWIYESKLGKRIQIMLQIAIRPASNEAINRSTIYASAVLTVAFCVSLLKVAIGSIFFHPWTEVGLSLTAVLLETQYGNEFW